MTTKSRIILGLVIFLAVVCYLLFLAVTADHSFESKISSAPVADETVVYGLNLEPGETITEEAVEQGKYPIEAFEIGPNQFIIDTPKRIGRYVQFDTSKDGVIDARDSVYPHLAIGMINPEDNTIRFIGWKDAGIRAMILDPKFLAPSSTKGEPTGYWKVHSTILMSDGSQWKTFHIGLSTAFIYQLKTSDPNQIFVYPTH